MARYTTRPRAWFDAECDDEEFTPDLSVCDHAATFTGLLDASGGEIWREPNPIGFGRDEEW